MIKAKLSNSFQVHLLAISTKHAARAYTIDPSGGHSELDFTFASDTEAYLSCSLEWHNRLYVFGGYNQRRQISRVVGCGLKRVGNLAFDFYYGACTTVNVDQVILCFPRDNKKRCQKAVDPEGAFTLMPSTRYEHYETRIASTNGEVLIFLYKTS